MWNVLLFTHIVISLLLITFILLQKTNDDGLSGISSGNNMGIMSAATTANFMTKTTIILAVLFFINSIILANLSSRKTTSILDKVEQSEQTTNPNNPTPADIAVPIAK